MDTASYPKTLQPSCSVQVFWTHMNQLLGNISTISRVLPIIKFWMSSHEYFKKRVGGKPTLLDKACPSTSSRLRRTLGKSVPSVEKQTTQCKITGLGGRTQIKKAKDNQTPISLIHLEKRRQIKREKAKKRHQQVPMY